jgi:hypothetical protein
VSRIVPALKAHNHIGVFRQAIHHFPFAFVAPLQADDGGVLGVLHKGFLSFITREKRGGEPPSESDQGIRQHFLPPSARISKIVSFKKYHHIPILGKHTASDRF